jgi:hypothetical protein
MSLPASTSATAWRPRAQDYLDHVRDPAHGYICQTLPIDEGRGNEFAVKVG